MRKQFRWPLVFLFIAAGIGVLLRWHFIFPVAWLKYPYWLHAHSHIMFLGWVFNSLFLAFLSNYNLSFTRYQKLFLFIQCLLVGMLISFPLQGYGTISIVLSILHTFSIWIFTFLLFRDFKQLDASISIGYAKVSLILFIISSMGPFALGPLVANGLGQSKWYYYAVYYYLHFQYNGVFIFGVLSLFYRLLEERGLRFNSVLARRSGLLLFISLFPTYFLSTLWADPGLIFNVVGFIGAILQLLSLLYFVRIVLEIGAMKVRNTTRGLVAISISSLLLKSILQLISAFPVIAKLAFDVRPFIIAYLHLVVIGVVTFFLLAWYIEKGIVDLRSQAGVNLLLFSFSVSELIIVVSGVPLFQSFSHYPALLLFFSTLMIAGIAIFLLDFYRPSVHRGFR